MSELEHQDHPHPSARQYVTIGVILSIITAVEVAIFYIESLESIIVPSLLVLSLAKFMLVVGYFMHLKFDSPLFRRLFVTGFILALAVFFIALATFFFRGGPVPVVTGG